MNPAGGELHIVILAAGEGTRMGLPGTSKVLLKVGGETIIEKVVRAAETLKPDSIAVIVGHKAEDVIALLSGRQITFVFQLDQLGTGHAVMQTEKLLRTKRGDGLILLGDVPLIQPETLADLVEKHRKEGAAATVLSMEPADPGGYGRIVRSTDGAILDIIEDRDADSQQLQIGECNSGIFCFRLESLFPALKKTSRENAQSQYYLTDTVRILREEGKGVHGVKARSTEEVLGINTPDDLLKVQKVYAQCAES
jgi:UDP-N-acetylglucosamine diphosphorylase/glucosamine-1-phosphate N-acetyltransferase